MLLSNLSSAFHSIIRLIRLLHKICYRLAET